MGKAKATKDTVSDLVDKSLEVSKDSRKAYEKKSYFVNSVHTAARSYKTEYLKQWQDAYQNEYYGKSGYGYRSQGDWYWNYGQPEGVREDARVALEAACDELDQLATDLETGDYNPQPKAKSLVEKFSKAAGAITAFEGMADEYDQKMKDALPEGSKVEVETPSDKEKGEDKYSAYVIDVNGEKIPISTAVNAFYTEYGMSAAAAVAYASVYGDNAKDEDLDKFLKENYKQYEKWLGTGIYDVASKEDQEKLYDKLKKSGWPDDLDKLGEEMRKGNKNIWPLFEDGTYGKYLTDQTGGDQGDAKTRNLALALGGLGLGVGGALPTDPAKTPEDEDKKKKKGDETDWSDGGGSDNGGSSGGSSGGGGKDGGGKDGDDDKSKDPKPDDDKTKEPDLKDKTKDQIPKPLDEVKKDYDALAREKFDEQFKTEEEYAEYLMKVNEEFESLSPEQLSAKLKEYGYDESEIQYLLQPENKDVAATAYASGKLNADLTAKANELAKADNAKNFDTKYDDPIDRKNDNESDSSAYAYLRDGDLNANVSPVNHNKDVKAAKETWTKSQEDYTKAATKANTAIEKANTKAAEVEKLYKQYGKDTSKWKESEVKKYNEAVESYNKAVTDAISANKEATTAKETMTKAQEAYDKKYNDYQDKIKKEARDSYAESRKTDSNNNGSNQSGGSDASSVTDTTPTGEVDPVQVNSDGSITI